MLFIAVLWTALLHLTAFSWAADLQDNLSFVPSSTIRATNPPDAVAWDGYSLFIKGQRLVVWSGEVHRQSLRRLLPSRQPSDPRGPSL